MKNQKPVGKYEISPYNEELMKMMGNFVSPIEKSPLSSNGVFFDDSAVMASDGYVGLLLKYKNKEEIPLENAVYVPDTLEKLRFRQLEYKNNIGRFEQDFFAEVEVKAFADAFAIARPNPNNCFYKVLISFNPERLTITSIDEKRKKYFDASCPCESSAKQYSFEVYESYLTLLLDFFEDYGVKKIKLYSDLTEMEYHVKNPVKPVIIIFDTPFGEALLQIKVYFGDDKLNENKKFQDILDKNSEETSNIIDTSPIILKYYFEEKDEVDLKEKANKMKFNLNFRLSKIVYLENKRLSDDDSYEQ